jgi:hypothetical protein
VNQQIQKLLINLQKVFSFRYSQSTWDSSTEVFERRQRENLAKLDDSNWMLETFQAALDSPGWLEHDGSSRNPLPKRLESEFGRKSSDTFDEQEMMRKHTTDIQVQQRARAQEGAGMRKRKAEEEGGEEEDSGEDGEKHLNRS